MSPNFEYAEGATSQIESRTERGGGYPMPHWLVDRDAKHTYLVVDVS